MTRVKTGQKGHMKAKWLYHCSHPEGSTESKTTTLKASEGGLPDSDCSQNVAATVEPSFHYGFKNRLYRTVRHRKVTSELVYTGSTWDKGLPKKCSAPTPDCH